MKVALKFSFLFTHFMANKCMLFLVTITLFWRFSKIKFATLSSRIGHFDTPLCNIYLFFGMLNYHDFIFLPFTYRAFTNAEHSCCSTISIRKWTTLFKTSIVYFFLQDSYLMHINIKSTKVFLLKKTQLTEASIFISK